MVLGNNANGGLELLFLFAIELNVAGGLCVLAGEIEQIEIVPLGTAKDCLQGDRF